MQGQELGVIKDVQYKVFGMVFNFEYFNFNSLSLLYITMEVMACICGKAKPQKHGLSAFLHFI